MAPDVSPAKTWEGFWGGIASVVLIASVIWYLLPARYDHLSYIAILAIAVTTALGSVVGDLTVSMVKRESGLKDSGAMLPGHGGMLDRLGSLCGAAPVGSTGSIGVSTLDVIGRHPGRYSVFALAAHSSAQALAEQCLVHRPRFAVMACADAAQVLAELLPNDLGTEVLCGEAALAQVAGD